MACSQISRKGSRRDIINAGARTNYKFRIASPLTIRAGTAVADVEWFDVAPGKNPSDFWGVVVGKKPVVTETQLKSETLVFVRLHKVAVQHFALCVVWRVKV